ncbi:hypothetical protein ACFWVF_37635 [Streptomyces sp. NPDC058659]|uniref:hypothetical protein n=1 Tax=unclassified Streptomyces TaxID=2593676 RepID=UPI003652EFE6
MLGIVGLLQTGCSTNGVGSTERPSTSSTSVTQQPSELLPHVMPTPTSGDVDAFPTPDDHARGSENLERLVRRETVWLAGYADGRITAQCPDKSPRSGMNFTCTSDILGVKVTWDVTVTSVSSSSVTYEFDPHSGLILRDGVVSSFYGEYTGAKTVRCNDIPEAVLVPLNEETTYACQAQYEGEGFSAPQRVTATTKGPALSD